MNQGYQEGKLHAYTSVISDWDVKSSVRTKRRRMLDEVEDGKVFFPESLAPCARHPLVVSQGAQSVGTFLTRRLYQYLDFTTILEQEIVNPVLLRLSRDGYGFNLPAEMRFDAYRIYCDEAYHALSAADLIRQVKVCTSVDPLVMNRPKFANVINRVRMFVPSGMEGLVDLCAAVVSETLISGTLSGIPADSAVVHTIREAVADHAADERTHHAYFTKVLEIVWPQLGHYNQTALGPLFGYFILSFLEPDKEAYIDLLLAGGFSQAAACQIFSDSHPKSEVLKETGHAARCTLRLLHRVGMLECQQTRESFLGLGLTIPDACSVP